MKLKKLIVSGFKSFADRTEFEFDEGISCVVGPNGCGKSNIVDAVKWVLGEQSAKSLRGSEMIDVIFNGSSARKAGGCAEVSLVFDNSSGVLQPGGQDGSAAPDTVSVGRRLYRSGQSDYLINNTPCRLKDIRELFMDTGVGHDAYALIEQGRVESFLQASQDDRRAIFDEAAGISKYKARKKEALRKLDRVEQNLLRVDDILGEVDKRLRSIKYQAGKARNYQIYSERLKELKSLHFLAQYHRMQADRGSLQQRLDRDNTELSVVSRRIEQLESTHSGTEYELADLDRSAAGLQGRLSMLAAQVTSSEERAGMLAERVQELRDQVTAGCAKCESLEAKIETCRQDQEARQGDLGRMDAEIADVSEQVHRSLQAFQDGEMAVTHLEAQLEDEKAGTIDLLRRTAHLHNDINASSIRRENLHNRREVLTDRARSISEQLEGLLARRSEAQAKLRDVEEVARATRARLAETRRAGDELSGSEQRLQSELTAARETRSSAAGRIEALEEMLARREGVDSGPRRVLEARTQGRLAPIRGMLGEFIRTDVRHATVVEAALAGADQQLVVDRFEDLRGLRKELTELLRDGGSVEFLCLDRLGAYQCDLDAGACEQMVGRVIDWVQFEPWLAPALWRLLGRTLVARTLDDAAAAARRLPSGLRFVTLSGEVIEADGRVRMGRTGSGGVISRRSELTELQAEAAELGRRTERLGAQWRAARDQRDHLEQTAQSLRTAIYEANTERVEAEGDAAKVDEAIGQLQQEEPVVAGDLAGLAAEIDQAVRAEHDAEQKAAEVEQLNSDRQQEIERLERDLADKRRAQESIRGKTTELKVALAHAQQKKVTLGQAVEALVQQARQRIQELAEAKAQIEDSRRRAGTTETAIETARSEAVRLTQERRSVSEELAQLEESRGGLQQRLKEIRQQVTEQRQTQEAATEKVNACRVEMGQLDAHVDDLLSRASDEMHMDLLELSGAYEHDDARDWAAVEAEINELRGKIERLGNVNLDAIEEQEELEQRREFLNRQLTDVRSSQRQIEELIDKLNTESHDRFLATFEAVRANFQELFRKLFGGGRADIVLTMPEDVLESGIEIVARPPGKELRNLSLLSGGEKTMTALALMFSMFRHRPSPFCLLDEVDAALDETNTERFSRLLQEFVAHSQFIVISHAKRTMSMANVLYGVTMHQPGVSTRISVKFEDVGHKLDQQLEPVAAK